MMAETAYTLGRTSSYEVALEEPGGCSKCSGGWAFKYAFDAVMYLIANKGVDFGDFVLDESFSVYTLALPNGWEQDVEQELAEDGAHHLKVEAKLGRP